MIFGFIFVYIIVMVFFYVTSSHIAGYEVKSGSLAVNNTYRGVVLRKEIVYKTKNSGYINYYAREGERVAKGALVYTVDESGKLSEMINSNLASGESLSDKDMSELKTQIINYHNNYSDKDFDSVYDFKFMVQGTVLKLSNQNVLSSLNDLANSSIKDFINFNYSEDSGIVIYSTDGLESLKDSDITEDTFLEENHAKTQLQSNSLIDDNDAAYKMITDEKWSVIIPVDKERALEIKDKGYLQVRFLKTGDQSWGAVTVFEKDGKQYAKLTFTNSMITFASDRYLDIELLLDTEVGLKIPNSAIVEKEFYLIPKDYITKGGDSADDGFMRETYLEDGTVSTEFINADIYYSTDDDYYVDTSVFRIGDYIIMPDSGDKFPISKKGSLIGVYNINKGYADFSQITILYQNKEYSVVKSNTDYGLNVYDHIVLDGNSVNADDFIFQ
jgi:hypothetical protein